MYADCSHLVHKPRRVVIVQNKDRLTALYNVSKKGNRLAFSSHVLINELKDIKLQKAFRHILLGVDKNEVLKLFELRGERSNKIGTVMP